ncbi:toll/interleukin-1 receptor domain-containing protein [Mesorhizobium sp. GbtcB19]|uniref:toll/interleukin-1 receptor domain-containing protein n=1 Tax=Mesorhizobium sp. GbtcB19 TaxID=2824764 RepID=UPI001C3051EA|nr:toll/interleukin-1 receptor domain-containing protein [Mesorhizobium sp. GbtcB19]
MAFDDRFEYDIFVSYAHNDNEGDAPWVSSFVKHLQIALKQRLGTDISIFFDTSALKGNEHLKQLTEKARLSALFLPIVSPSYIVRDWTLAELTAFSQRNNSEGKIFAVEILPIENRAECTPPLDTLISTPFWYRPPETSAPIPIDLEMDKERFCLKIADLAEKLRSELTALRRQAGVPVERRKTPKSSAPSVEGKTVLLAQVTGDLEAERSRLKSYLEQYDIAVISEDNYPQGGAEFRQAFAADCRRASMFVQLLGEWSERRPPDLPEGYACSQYDIAKAEGLKPFLWCRPDIDRKAREEHRDARLFVAPELNATGMEEFKARIVRFAAQQDKSRPPGQPSSSASIFVDSDQTDFELAKVLANSIESIEARKRRVVLPVFKGLPEDILRDFEETILECSGMVVVFGQSQPTWVRARLRHVSKLGRSRSEAPIKVLAVYLHPPREKDELGIVDPQIIWIDGQNPDSPDVISKVLGALD